MALDYLLRRIHDDDRLPQRRIEPRLDPEPRVPESEVFDSGAKTIVDCAHVRVERLDTHPVLFSKVFKEFEDWKGQKYDYRYWAERENYFLREFLKKQNEFTHVVQARHLISENEAAKQVLTCDAGITIANWLRVKARYADTATLSNPFQRSDAFLRLIRACLVALKQLHENRIVHCDIKEDNICIPYAPNPFPGREGRIHLEFEKLKLIDFAFSIAHAIPLTQILVINPDERVAYQSELLISALHADRRGGSPNAVQQLDCRVDLFSLGYMAEKISAAGLDCPPGGGDGKVLEGIRDLVQKLKAFDSAPRIGSLPHDGLIAEIDGLLVDTARFSASLEFNVDGEWSAEEMARDRRAGRKTPSTPVALPLPTPVSVPFAIAPRQRDVLSRTRLALLLGLALTLAVGGAFLYREAGDSGPSRAGAALESKQAPAAQRLPPVAPAEAENRAAAAYGKTVASAAPLEERARAMNRLIRMAAAGNKIAAQRVAAFEKNYDEVKQTVAKSVWWTRGQGTPPEEAARWMENGELLAENGDRPAMLDLAFAVGHGRIARLDRVTSVETYLKVMDLSAGGDETSARIRRAAVHGLAAMLSAIVEQKDQDAAQRVLPVLRPKADAGAADLQYYSGLLSECAIRPAKLDAARQWYRKAAVDPDWKRTAEQKARLLGRWCPRP